MSILLMLAIVILGAVFLIIPGLLIGGLIPVAPSYSKMDRCLKENIDDLSCLINALSELDYDYLAIRKTTEDNTMYAANVLYDPNTGNRLGSDGADVPIPDELIGIVEQLYKKGFHAVFMYRNSYVEFARWSSLSESRGIAYSMNGDEPAMDNVIDMSPLAEENWYYYVSNFEKWKESNPHLFNNTY